MPSHTDADRPVSPPPPRGVLDDLITQARQLRGSIDAVRPRASDEDGHEAEEPARRWQRALCDLAAHQLDDLGEHLGQLREAGLGPCGPYDAETAAYGAGTEARTGNADRADGAEDAGSAGDCVYASGTATGTLTSRAGSAEWNLLTDEVSWSQELYAIFGRTADDGPLSLDELPSWVLPDDQPPLAAAVTDCLVDGRPIDQEFRIMRPDGAVRSLHLLGEPVLDGQGGTASMWAVVRDVSELRRSELAVREMGRSVPRRRDRRHPYERDEGADVQAERRLAAELQESVLPPWQGTRRVPYDGHGRAGGEGALDIASHYLPSAASTLIGGDWYDALDLPDGATLLSAGDLTGHGVAAASGMAMLLGAVRGMAFAGVGPGALMGHLNRLLDASAQPALGSAVCCRYDPRERTLVWSQAGHPAPLVFRGRTGRALSPPRGVLLGAACGAAYGESTEVLCPGDVLVLYTDGLEPLAGQSGSPGGPRTAPERLLRLGPRFAQARSAQECLRTVVEEFGGERESDACVLVARVSG
ncbi:PP2C family protein-serine/threonine phosphatase [Streptomyces marispadix]|uniref:SpoIIE family protein phosphatase n=1 Tax=Streptomyces marispadix TaxID=2922868 RepID=A0ABS9SRY0_9ACTN|nr:SpoIIE family protein phosphatase [Streptomyces marispadix]MCH6159029.1 SpoIIE family protein phosphatase [Streptomyces marispadix]